MSQEWNLTNLAADLQELYQEANNQYAIEWQSGRFWAAVLEAFKDLQNAAMRISFESPPDADPRSEYRLRRVDLVLSAYQSQPKKRIVLMFAEFKRANARSAEYREVELQAQGACEAYLNARGVTSSVVFGMCCVGTRCRMFKYIKDRDFDWMPMWGTKKEFDVNQYFDALDPFGSRYIWAALNSMSSTVGIDLADKSYLYTHLCCECRYPANSRRKPNPPPPSQPVLPTQAAASSSAVTSPITKSWYGYVLERTRGRDPPQGLRLHFKIDGNDVQRSVMFENWNNPPKIHFSTPQGAVDLQSQFGTDGHLYVQLGGKWKKLGKPDDREERADEDDDDDDADEGDDDEDEDEGDNE